MIGPALPYAVCAVDPPAAPGNPQRVGVSFLTSKFRYSLLGMLPPNVLRFSCAASIDRNQLRDEFSFQNRPDLARRVAASTARACWAAAPPRRFQCGTALPRHKVATTVRVIKCGAVQLAPVTLRQTTPAHIRADRPAHASRYGARDGDARAVARCQMRHSRPL